MKNKTIQLLAVLFTLSVICVFLSLLTGRIIFALLGLPGVFFISSVIHEMGHMIACVINGNRLTKIRVYFLEYSESKIKLRDQFGFDSSCSFIRSRNDAVVYIGGPTASLLLTLILLIMWILTRKQTWAIFFAVFLLRLFRNIVSQENNDIQNAIREIQREKKTNEI